ncbi:hypothetical protein [Paenibacillus sp. N3.4]|nr:hypothetical protein [Paenibacillus sp. N3.4]
MRSRNPFEAEPDSFTLKLATAINLENNQFSPSLNKNAPFE